MSKVFESDENWDDLPFLPREFYLTSVWWKGMEQNLSCSWRTPVLSDAANKAAKYAWSELADDYEEGELIFSLREGDEIEEDKLFIYRSRRTNVTEENVEEDKQTIRFRYDYSLESLQEKDLPVESSWWHSILNVIKSYI